MSARQPAPQHCKAVSNVHLAILRPCCGLICNRWATVEIVGLKPKPAWVTSGLYRFKSVITAVPGDVGPFISLNSALAPDNGISLATIGLMSTSPRSIIPSSDGYFQEGMPRVPKNASCFE